LVEAVRAAGHSCVTFADGKDRLAERVRPNLQPGDMVVTLGAGDIWKVGVELLEQLA
jgi:UDP-N-acetylmuramate--alanine ligase